jgi:Leucine-rich repeat (LRR) protein
MRRSIIGIVIFLILILLASLIYAVIPDQEREALVALYNSTNGANWDIKTNWLGAKGTEGTWYGVTVENIGGTDHVTHIYLVDNNLNGTIPSQLGNLGNLQYLTLRYNYLSGTIPSQLGNLSHLIKIILDGKENDENIGLSGSIPTWFGNLTNLVEISLGRNNLTGAIPAELGKLNRLEILFLSLNKISGDIPSQLGNLSKLKEITLFKNELSGSIPAWLGNLSNLVRINLSDNDFSGPIPTSLGNPGNLQFLEIAGNRISGGIPDSIGNLGKLESLKLDHNQLSGLIPPGLTNLTKLRSPNLDISFNCLSANDAQLRNWLDNIDPDWEVNQNECTSPEISVNRTRLNFGYIIGSGNLPDETFTISNSGGGTLNWTASTEIQLITFNPASGTNSGVVEVKIDPGNLLPGEFKGIIYVSDSAATNSPVEIEIYLTVKSHASNPIGEFSTPIHGAAVCSSIPVTGWALGDTGMGSVKIYRGESSNLVYIGDAVFVEGARPDVEAAYPGYPMNYKAGWGYMMLTNFLPNGGNGTFNIRAIATDKEGQTTTLGIKTITCDNANAVKPFGAIDTPAQGGTASGSSFINWGWALTPRPNSIPTHGSTINVWVDGINLGNPTYNIYRSDIASLFPGYANSNGSAGYFYLDTTSFSNGVHTIQWTVTDNAGNTDGIGSRYFTIQNIGSSASQHSSVMSHWSLGNEELSSIPINHEPVIIRKGCKSNMKINGIYPGDIDITTMEIKEMERVEIQVSPGTPGTRGYMLVGNQLRPLPIGTTFETGSGIFYWQPGPGFIGEYRFVFIEIGTDGAMSRKNILVKILPKFENFK